MKMKDIPPSDACIVLATGPAPLRMRAVASAIGVAAQQYRDASAPRITAVAITATGGRIVGIIEAHELLTDAGSLRSQHPEAHSCVTDRGKFECRVTDDAITVYFGMIKADATFAIVRGGPADYAVSREDIAKEIIDLQEAALRHLGQEVAA